MSSTEGPLDVHQALLDYEDGHLAAQETLTLFAYMIKTELVWSLRPSFCRTANVLLGQGMISHEGRVLFHITDTEKVVFI